MSSFKPFIHRFYPSIESRDYITCIEVSLKGICIQVKPTIKSFQSVEDWLATIEIDSAITMHPCAYLSSGENATVEDNTDILQAMELYRISESASMNA